MIAGDVKVIKFCIHCNEVETNTCDWLPIIYQTTEVGWCYFALDSERGDFSSLGNERGEKKEKKRHFFSHMETVVCVRRRRAEGGSSGGLDVTVLKSLNM